MCNLGILKNLYEVLNWVFIGKICTGFSTARYFITGKLQTLLITAS